MQKELTLKQKLVKTGSAFAPNRIFDISYPKTRKPNLIALYLALSAHTDSDLIAFPSQKRLVEMAGGSVRTAKTVIADMARMHLIEIQRTHYKSKTRNKYRLLPPRMWLTQSAGGALGLGHFMHPNKNQENNKKDTRVVEIARKRAELATKMSMHYPRGP